jgi:hypothetical protein
MLAQTVFEEDPMWKKSSMCAAAAIALTFALLLAGCDQNSQEQHIGPDNPTYDPGNTITDDPSKGIMSVETANKVYEWVHVNNNSVTIKKFKSAAALREYLEVGTVVNMAVGGPSYAETLDASGYDFVLKYIGGLPITVIWSNAFAPATGVEDISSVVKTIVLPDTITSLGTKVFTGVGAGIVVDIPPTVVEKITGESAYSAGTSEALENILGGDVTIVIKAETDEQPIVPPIPPANPSLVSVTSSWSDDGKTLTVTLKYSQPVTSVEAAPAGSWNTFSNINGGITWASTYKGDSTDTDTWYVPLQATAAYEDESKTATKAVSLVNGDLTRPGNGNGPDTYKIIGYFNGPGDTRIAGLAKETATSTGMNGKSTYGPTVWKTIPTGDIRAIFEAIYEPNAQGMTDVFLYGADIGKTAVTFTSDISKKALQLFHVTLASSTDGTGDGIKIQGPDLPAETGEGYTASSTNLIIIDVGRPNSNNSGLPVFRIPDRRLGKPDGSGEYGYIRLRVNKGARLVIEADNSGYDTKGEGHSCPDGRFNYGCVEVMTGGDLRDGAWEGFPLGAKAVILNRNGSYLSVGSEGTAKNNYWYSGYLIGPDGTGDKAPRIVWDSGSPVNKYIEVRPGELAIDANVTVKKGLGLIYSVFLLNDTVVSIDTAAYTSGSLSLYGGGSGSVIIDEAGGLSDGMVKGPLSGLAVNIHTNDSYALTTDSYRFYAVSDSVKIILEPSTTSLSNGIQTYALGGTLSGAKSNAFIIAGSTATDGIVITGTLGTGSDDETYGGYSDDTGIYGYNKWWTELQAGTLVTALSVE